MEEVFKGDFGGTRMENRGERERTGESGNRVGSRTQRERGLKEEEGSRGGAHWSWDS